ncbi:hypothetical protein [Streptomyces adustus]|uniref:hypothetical protein n=1 Tax=Streptomyces adustus TaxID=1609272 RepID=UPI0037231FE4
MSADALTLTLGLVSTDTDHRDWLAPEDIALVRPYVLAWEKGTRSRSTVAVTRSVLAGAL